MLIYLDMCCLKRPFDDQTQPRIRLESEAVLALLAAEGAELRFVRSAAMRLENSRNPLKERALRVEKWIDAQNIVALNLSELETRTAELMQLGFKNFDALHLATSVLAPADIFATCDDGLRATAKKNARRLKVRVVSVLQLAQEVLK